MAGGTSTLIIPVENQVRELDGKLLLSCIAAERGFPVTLGSRTYIHYGVADMPRGVYLAKSMRTLSDRMFDILRKLGHEIVAWDEEGLVRPADAYYYERRLSATAIRKVAALFAWGPDNARTFESFPACAGVPVHVTGNPRVDMLRSEVRPYYADEVRRLRDRFGRFVLVNSNFGHANHFVQGLRTTVPGSEPLDDFMATLSTHRSAILDHFRQMIPKLSAELPTHTILVRPHPIERHDTWNEIAAGCSNVVVANEGNVIPWLMASEALVQNGCQTAIEAALVGTPVVNYKPIAHEAFDLALIENLSHEARDLGSLLDMVRSIANGELGAYDHPDRKRHIERHIAALDGPLASERMIDVLERAGYGTQQPPKSPTIRFLGGWVRTKIRTAIKMINMQKRDHRNSADYHSHRFPELSVEELRSRIERFQRQLGRFESVRVERSSRHIFQIHSG